MPTSGRLHSSIAQTQPADHGRREISKCRPFARSGNRRRGMRPRTAAVRFEHIATATTCAPCRPPEGQRSRRRGDCVAARWRSPPARTPRPTAPCRRRSARLGRPTDRRPGAVFAFRKARRCQVPPSSAPKMYTAPEAGDPKLIVVPLSLASPGSLPQQACCRRC